MVECRHQGSRLFYFKKPEKFTPEPGCTNSQDCKSNHFLTKKHFIMKSKILVALLIASVSYSACTKSADVTPKDKVDKQLIAEVTQLTNLQAQKTAYRSMNKTEKYELWQEHLRYFLNDKALTEKQLEVLNLVIETITPEFFTHDEVSENSNYEKIVQIDYLVKAVFKGDLRTAIFSNIGERGITPNYVVKPNCECSQKSDYCSGAFNTCYDMAHLDLCKEVPGCGLLLLYKCNGQCFGNPQ
jgi:hypothetical protein